MWKFPFPELTVPFPQARCGELLRSKYLCCQTPFCLYVSFYSHFVNQLKPQALKNTYERTLKLQWFTITHRNKHERNRTLNLYKLAVFHRSYKLMILSKSWWFRPPYYNPCWRTCSRLVASCVSDGYCHSSAICRQWCWLSLELGVFSNLPLATMYFITYLLHHIHGF